MGFKTPPNFIESELDYPYLTKMVTDDEGNEVEVLEKFTYKFPRLRKKDAEVDASERREGKGYKANPAERLSKIVENVSGWEDYGLPSRGADEAEGVFRQRVLTFFSPENMQEYAEHALLARTAGVFPNHSFRSSAPSGLVQLGSRRESGPGASLSDLHPPGQGSPE